MTDDERKQEGADEEIEDLEAPAEAQEDVAGGLDAELDARCKATARKWCPPKPTYCSQPTCKTTAVHEV